MPILGFNEAGDNGQAACLARAFANLNLFCSANNMKIYSIRGFTVANMHAARNAFPWLGCKGADSITILKWISILCRLAASAKWLVTHRKKGFGVDVVLLQGRVILFAGDPWTRDLDGAILCVPLP